ncbi:MFS transporter [Actinomycetospora cinnamomea]|uniref:DHA1 family inner membrane transport protein n=1 Tax=Actinomycetospora cinnamomea TaxID=663609 RepID=A0A2U1FQQ5_9PSEU|nr:MFS transporter [Actinomycetospora cinnamomea]PVZ14442.1 DHA1 family inner membrane transport protein [Actinomycetospora cinnamomea]
MTPLTSTAPAPAAEAPRHSPARGSRVPAGVSLAALSLGGLAIGTTEFASMGVLPGFAADLGVSVPAAGAAISAYALGVVVGAPLIALVGARWPRKHLVVALAVFLVVANALSALAPSFVPFVALRFLAGLPHGAYFGTAAVLGAALVPPERRARALATVMLGLTIANIVGVPAATWLGETLGWRSAYVAVTAIALVTVLAVVTLVPNPREAGGGSIRGELTALTRPQVWLTLGVIAAGFGGLFAVYSYINPILTNQAGVGATTVPLMLGALGVGMTIGNVAGGRFAERAPRRTIAIALAVYSMVLVAFVFAAHDALAATVGLFALGFVGMSAGPALMGRLIDFAAEGPSLAAATFHSAFNVANAVGAALGGVVLAAGLGLDAPAAVGAALPLIGLVVLAVSVGLERRTAR